MSDRPAITRGDLVRTAKGAAFEGIVLAVYDKIDGTLHATVEACEQKFRATTHVYPIHQLELVERGALYAHRLQESHKGGG